MRKLVHTILFVFAAVSLCCINISCGQKEENKSVRKRIPTVKTISDSGTVHMKLPDTLRVVTLYSPMSYFLYRDDTLGYDYSLIKQFTAAKNMELSLTIASSLEHAVNMLDSGLVDLIAYEVPVTSDYVKTVYPCGPENYTAQVLVQRIREDKDLITNVTELVGKDIWVLPNSKYLQRLDNLDSELGGGINIKLIDRDTIIDEDIIEMVSKDEIPLSIVDGYTARLNKTYYNNIDVSLEVSFRQRSSWGVSPVNSWLGDTITVWFESEGMKRENAELLRQYFEESKTKPALDENVEVAVGDISAYDELFKKYASSIGWDWRLMAAMGYAESHFDNEAVSWAGARGLMQIMPSTARGYGVDPDSLVIPAVSIETAAKCIENTEKRLEKYIEDPSERRLFVIAAYNSGLGHIIDAINLAKKNDYDPKIWYDNVESALMLKGDERYYNDPVVKYGYFRGRETIDYVRKVFNYYERILARAKEREKEKEKEQKNSKSKNRSKSKR